jgi:hypothetical protein
MGRGKRRAGPDNVRLRDELKLRDADITWYRGRLMEVSRANRALRASAEVADGQRVKAEQLVVRQTAALQAKNSEIADLRRQLQAASSDTVEMPVPTAVT